MMIIAICIVNATRSQNPAPNHSAACIGELPMPRVPRNTMPTATTANTNASGNQRSNQLERRRPVAASQELPELRCTGGMISIHFVIWSSGHFTRLAHDPMTR